MHNSEWSDLERWAEIFCSMSRNTVFHASVMIWTRKKSNLLNTEGAEYTVEGVTDLPTFIKSLETPRKIMMLVPAGKIVDSVIENLIPFLEKGDIVIDGGNSHFTDTETREKYLAEKGFEFLGVGVSGGEEGARHGASIMPGGNRESYEHIAPDSRSRERESRRRAVCRLYGKFERGAFCQNGS